MKVKFWEYAAPPFISFALGYWVALEKPDWWIVSLIFLPICALQLYILDKRDPNGILNCRR